MLREDDNCLGEGPAAQDDLFARESDTGMSRMTMEKIDRILTFTTNAAVFHKVIPEGTPFSSGLRVGRGGENPM